MKLFLTCIFICLFGFIRGEVVDEGPHIDQVRNMRGWRYCEILVSNSRLGMWHLFELTAFNTLMFGCDEKKWDNLTEQQVKTQFNSILVKMNGPRYWTMDTVGESSTLIDPNLTYIGGIKWIVVGIVNASYYDVFLKLVFGKVTHYMERYIKRKTIYIFRQNELVYIMTSPTGKTFVMQSFSSQYAPLTLESLRELGSMLNPPSGWKYSVVRLDRELAVEAENEIGVVINDDFFNSYSQFDKSLLFGTELTAGSDPVVMRRDGGEEDGL